MDAVETPLELEELDPEEVEPDVVDSEELDPEEEWPPQAVSAATSTAPRSAALWPVDIEALM